MTTVGYRHPPGAGQIEFHELDLALPHFSEEVVEHLDRESFSRAAPIA
jgi:hypothetical protein